MSFNYDKMKRRESEGMEKFFVSYADLFANLSFVFLFLFFITTLRAGVTTLARKVEEEQSIKQKQVELEQKMKALETQREEYLAKHGTAGDKELYEQVTSRIALLSEEAKDESAKHRELADAADRKKQELNYYQTALKTLVESTFATKNKLIDEKKVQRRLASENKSLESQREALESEKSAIAAEYEAKLQNTVAELQKSQARYEAKVAGVREQLKTAQGKFREELRAEQARYEQQLGEVSGELARQKGEAAQKLAASAGALAQAKGALASAKADRAQALRQAEFERGKHERLMGEIASKLKRGFSGSGLNLDVDPKSGEVTIDFGRVYFDYGSSELKPEMAQTLRKAMPIYAATVFGDPSVARHIQSVEIVGFASPTYRGKVIDPSALNEETKAAMNLNLDLSFRRARAIFKYVFDRSRMQFDHQSEMFTHTKVAGMSYMGSRALASEVGSSASAASLKNHHRVMIKFHLNEGKSEDVR